MVPHRSRPLLRANFSLAVILFSMAKGQPSHPIEYCSPVNTADMEPFSYTWQSEGRCFGNCTDLNYAFAVLNNYDCWCSNVVPNPDDQKPVEECQFPCPGYPTDYCGGNGGLFGYLEIAANKPTATAPAGFGLSASTSTTSSGRSTPTTPTIQTVTVGGVVQTVTVSPDATATSDPALSGVENNAGLETGAIVGIVIGVIGGLLVLAAFIWLFLMKRRKENQNAGTGYISPIPGGGSPGTMTTPTTGEISGGGIFAAGSQSSGKRRSYLMPVDPRLDPFRAGGPNKSRESFTSLQDNEDYSRPVHEPPRVLRATNPDPDDD